MLKYMIYGKHDSHKRYRPYDDQDNELVTNLIYASLFHDYDVLRLRIKVSHMNVDNADYKFQIREI